MEYNSREVILKLSQDRTILGDFFMVFEDEFVKEDGTTLVFELTIGDRDSKGKRLKVRKESDMPIISEAAKNEVYDQMLVHIFDSFFNLSKKMVVK